ncbi:MAG: peptide MFS transporter [Chitinophagales bacterium]|nr:peptide MFS transporter [Bacteroidota bacterium]
MTESIFKTKVLGHPAGLFVLFFTEMWERFSYYGMRALLVIFLTASLLDNGWGWTRENALALFGTYTALVYLSTLLGGYAADHKMGYRWAVVLGALLMTLGHAFMAGETPLFIYLGLTALVLGSGFFKPNMTAIISEMYEEHIEKKDGAFTIYYMGVNAGAFFGILFCGYLGENYGWRYGFSLAGIFMLFGLLQFWLAQDIFGDIGKKPHPHLPSENTNTARQVLQDKRVPFSLGQNIIIAICSLVGFLWVLNDPIEKISDGKYSFFPFSWGSFSGGDVVILATLALFLLLLGYRLRQYSKITREKLIAVGFFAFITIFFWAIFEQAPGTLTIFAKSYTNRVLDGTWSHIFKVVNALMTLIPLGIVSWVLYLLFQKTFEKYAFPNIVLALSFVIVWGIAIWMIRTDFAKETSEIPATWFGVLNSLYIITFAPLFSRIWESKYNPNANLKFGIGMFLLAAGMAVVAIGSRNIGVGAQTASVSMLWLVFVYLFHTLGELCISPLGLSYVSKLVPPRMISFMFGIWYLAIAIGNKTAGKLGENIDKIANVHGISYFFWILCIIPLVIGVLAILLTPLMRKYMHGVR